MVAGKMEAARLVARGDVAVISSMLTSTMTLCHGDPLFKFMSNQLEGRVREQHSTPQAVKFINDLCAQPQALREWGFSEEQCRVVARQRGIFTGFAGMIQHCLPDPVRARELLPLPAQIDEASFLNPMLMLLLPVSRDFSPLTLADLSYPPPTIRIRSMTSGTRRNVKM